VSGVRVILLSIIMLLNILFNKLWLLAGPYLEIGQP